MSNSKVNQSLRLGLLSLGIILAITGTTQACSCVKGISVCESVGDAAAVFVGTVIEAPGSNRTSQGSVYIAGSRTYRFAVSRGFLGVKTGEVVSVQTALSASACGFRWFETGVEYLVYAYRDDGKLATSSCHRTKQVAEARAELVELDSIARSRGSQVTGKVVRHEVSDWVGRPYRAIANRPVRLIRADATVLETRTDRFGKFVFSSLKGGVYRLDAGLIDGWKIHEYGTEEFFINSQGCAIKYLSFANDSEVAVRVFDPDGKPVDDILIEIYPVGVKPKFREPRWRNPPVTDSQGEWVERGLPPGRYTVAINYVKSPGKYAPYPTTFAPGVFDESAAQVIEIKPGSKVRDVVIRIPKRAETIAVTGEVVWPDGTLAKGASVGLEDVLADDSCISCKESIADGRFRLTGYAGRTYKVWARASRRMNGREIKYAVHTRALSLHQPKTFRLILRPLKE